MSLQREFEQAAEELITEVFGPAQLPELNRPAVFHFQTNSTGYNDAVNENDESVEYCLRSDYEEGELRNEKIKIGDLRFYVLQRELNELPTADRTYFTWNNIRYQVKSVVLLGSAAYEIQARVS